MCTFVSSILCINLNSNPLVRDSTQNLLDLLNKNNSSTFDANIILVHLLLLIEEWKDGTICNFVLKERSTVQDSNFV